MSLERFIAGLERAGVWFRPRGDHLDFRCPMPDHDDSNASGSADWKPPDSRKPVGRVVFKCHACGEGRNPDLLAVLGLSEVDLYDDPPRRPDDQPGSRVRGASSTWSSTRSSLPPGAAASTAPKAKVDKPKVDKSTPPKSGPTRQTTYLYRDAAGTELFKKIRLDPIGPDAAERRKTFRWQHRGGPRGGWQPRARCEGHCARCKSRFDPDQTQNCPSCGVRRVCDACQAGQTPSEAPLYRLPETVAAVAAGQRVWLCEGEKDADALAAVLPAGEAATSAPSSGWTESYTETLAGAAVTVLADRDEPGYKRAVTVAAALHEAGCTVRVARTPLGERKADAADHLAAGLELDEFEDVPSAVLNETVATLADAGRLVLADSTAAALGIAAADPVPEQPEEHRDPDDAAGGGESEGGRVVPMPSRGRNYGGGGGGTGGGGSSELPVRVIREHFEAGPDGLYERKVKDGEVLLTELLDVKVRLEARVQADLGDDSAPELSWVDLVASRDGESVRLTQVSRERWEKCQFLADLPWSARWDDTVKGRSKIRNAISATSGPVPLQTCYTALGWREIEGRQVYVHAGGGIDASGPARGVLVRPPDPLADFVLPDPPTDPETLRAAVHSSTALLDVAPGRLASPLLGGTYRALLGYSPVTLMPVGPPGTGKTALAAFATQHYAPATRAPDSMPNIGGNEATGGTINALSELRYRAGDMLCPVEDIAPDAGIAVAARRSAELLRGQYNRFGKNRQTRELDLRPAHRPRGTLMITAEESPSVASAESRALSLKVNRGDLRPAQDMAELDRGGGPARRAQLTAAMARHLAARPSITDEWLRESAVAHAEALRDPQAEAGVEGRQASLVAEAAVGWQVMLEVVVAEGALTQDEADALWARVWEGLVEAKQYLVAGFATRTPEQRVRELLRSLLIRSEMSLSGRFDEQPATPDRCGWTKLGEFEFGAAWRQNAPKVGWTDGQKVWLHPSSVFPMLDRHAAAQQEPLNVTKDNLAAMMAAAGVITTRYTKRGPRYTVSARVGAARSPLDLWELSWQWLWGPGDEDDGEPELPHPGPIDEGPEPASGPAPDAGPAAEDEEEGLAPEPRQASLTEALGAEEGEPDESARSAEPADRLCASADDEVIVVGVDGPVRFAPGRVLAPCRHCGRDDAMFTDPLGPVHPMCALNPPSAAVPPVVTPPGSPAEPAEDLESGAVGAKIDSEGPGEADEPAERAPAAVSDDETPATAPGAPEPAPMPGLLPGDSARPWPRPSTSGRWRQPAAVLDTRGVFLPDGTLRDWALPDLAAILDAGEEFGIGHPSGPGLLIVTEELCDQLGLGHVVPDPAASEDAQRRHILDSLAEADQLIDPARAAGWHVDGERAETHMRWRRGPQGDERVLSVLLEPFLWVWDPRGSGLATGTEETALPAIDDPVARWSELARRAGRITELLGVQFPFTAGQVGQAMFNQEQTRRRRKGAAGAGRDRAGRNRARVVETPQPLPELAGHRRGRLLEPPLAWNRTVAPEVLERARWMHGFDIRKQFLPAFNIDLGYCGPDTPAPLEFTDPAAIAEQITAATKLAFGLWRVALPGWEDPRLPAPHPYQRGQETRVWVTSPTLRLLLGEEDASSPGVGYSLETLAPDAAWVWPEQGRLFDGWVKRLREAIYASREDPAVTAHLKLVFAGYRGRMLSAVTADTVHHQPAWAEAILAAARAEQWRKVRRAALDPQCPRWPSLITADEVVYLAESDDPATVAPMADTGAIGEFSYRRSLGLDDEVKARIREHGHNLKLARVWTQDSTETLGQAD